MCRDRCDPDVYERGETIAITHLSKKLSERFVRSIRKHSKIQAVDWHYVGGLTVVKAIGTPQQLETVRRISKFVHSFFADYYQSKYLEILQ